MNSYFHNYLPQKLKHIFTVENDFKNKYDNYIRSTFHNDHWYQFTNLEDTILPADDH